MGRRPYPSTAGRHARFILSLIQPREPWKAGPFNVVEAYATWDEDHRRAFLAWANDPGRC